MKRTDSKPLVPFPTKVDWGILNTYIPVFAAVCLYQTDCDSVPPMTGSEPSLVACRVVPVVEPDVPERVSALAKSSFAGAEGVASIVKSKVVGRAL